MSAEENRTTPAGNEAPATPSETPGVSGETPGSNGGAAGGSANTADVGSGTPEAALDPNLVAEWIAKAAKADEHYERLVRLTADFDNFKKRAARERDEARRSAVEGVLGKLLPVVDNFDMAMLAAQQPATTMENLRAGVAMIHQQLRSLLGDLGAEEIPAVGTPFDPSLHEAVSQQESAEVPEGQVLQQLRKGYRIRERLLRPASVVVAKKPSAS